MLRGHQVVTLRTDLHEALGVPVDLNQSYGSGGEKTPQGPARSSCPAKGGEEGVGCKSRTGPSRHVTSRSQDAEQQAWVSKGPDQDMVEAAASQTSTRPMSLLPPGPEKYWSHTSWVLRQSSPKANKPHP